MSCVKYVRIWKSLSNTKMKIFFEKISGSGNDFVIVDNRDGKFDDIDKSALAQKLCNPITYANIKIRSLFGYLYVPFRLSL